MTSNFENVTRIGVHSHEIGFRIGAHPSATRVLGDYTFLDVFALLKDVVDPGSKGKNAPRSSSKASARGLQATWLHCPERDASGLVSETGTGPPGSDRHGSLCLSRGELCVERASVLIQRHTTPLDLNNHSASSSCDRLVSFCRSLAVSAPDFFDHSPCRRHLTTIWCRRHGANGLEIVCGSLRWPRYRLKQRDQRARKAGYGCL